MEGRIPAWRVLHAAPEPYCWVMRRRGLRRFLLPAALFALAGCIGLAAVGDHEWKTRRTNREELREWYCIHVHTQCGGRSPAEMARQWEEMERQWNQRQLGYEIAVVVIGGTAIALAAARVLRGKRLRRGRRVGAV